MEATNEKTGFNKRSTKAKHNEAIEAQAEHRKKFALVRGKDGKPVMVERTKK